MNPLEDVTEILARCTGLDSNLVFKKHPSCVSMLFEDIKFYVFKAQTSHATLQDVAIIAQKAGLQLRAAYTVYGERIPINTDVQCYSVIQWR